jgi:phthiodiolone/phenolphthiodiolone dimycocerosates ketoreductase
MSSGVITSVGYWASRWMPGTAASAYAKQLEDSGVVDEFVIWDQMTNWWPHAQWRADVSPMAEAIPDIDSIQDPFLACAYAQASTTSLSVAVSTDAARRDPPELLQAMTTLSNATAGGARLVLGAGETRHITPFGRKRSVGLKRLEDTLRVFRLWFENDGPVDFNGQYWQMKNAWIGKGGFERRPQVIAVGGGPKLIDIAAELADGLVTGSPFVFADPTEYGQFATDVRERVRSFNRDPSRFTLGLYHVMFLCDDRQQYLDNLDHPLLKWYAATGGRIDQHNWAKEGIEPVLPEDWHYALHMLPAGMSREEVDEIIDQVKPEMVEKSFVAGTPAQVAELLRAYSDNGCGYHLLADIAPAMIPTDPERVIARYIELCRLIKR